MLKIDPYKDIAYAFTSTTLPWKWNRLLHRRPLLVAEYRTKLKSVWPIKPILRNLTLRICAYLNFPEDTAYAVLFMNTISTLYRNLNKFVGAALEKIVILGGLKIPIFEAGIFGFELKVSTIIMQHKSLQLTQVLSACCSRCLVAVFQQGLFLKPVRLFLQLSLSLMLRPTVSRPICLGIKHPSGAYDQIFFFRSEYGIRLTVTFFIPWDALSDERTGVSFVCAAGPCQRSLSGS
jgi:hypothetical protein